MGLKSVAIVLCIFICWWLIRRWTTYQQKKTAQASVAPGSESAVELARRKRQQISTAPSSPYPEQPTLPPPHAEYPASPGRIAVNFNEIEIDNSHSPRPQSPDLPIKVAQTRAFSRDSALRREHSTREARKPGSRSTCDSSALVSKVSYLEKQVHENNRDITMLSEKLANAIDARRASERQYQHRLQLEQDRALFHEARLQSDLEKLSQVKQGLKQQGMTLEQLLEWCSQAGELEQQTRRNRQEIARLNELLTLAKGYQTGSNKRNEELRALLRQAERIAELEA